MKEFLAGLILTLVIGGIGVAMLLNNETYLHGVRIVSNGYGEDVYLAMERVT